jgi:hypothetical protein
MSIPTISKGWEKEIWTSTVLGSALDTVALEGISMPKWAKADPDITQTATIVNKAACFFFIISSFLIFFDEVKKIAKKKATGFWRLHDAQPSWLKAADLIV